MTGQSYCSQAQIKLNRLKELKKAFLLLEREMSVNLCEMSQAVLNVANRSSDNVIKNVFLRLSDGLDDCNTFADVFERVISGLDMDKNLITNIISAGQGIGYMDLNSNSNMISIIVEELENEIKSSGEKLPAQQRVYRTIAIAVGISIGIILI